MLRNKAKVKNAKVLENKDGTIQFEPCENADNFKKFYSLTSCQCSEKLPIASNEFNISILEDYIAGKISETSCRRVS